jgi:Secretion system C-terminal sorting domain
MNVLTFFTKPNPIQWICLFALTLLSLPVFAQTTYNWNGSTATTNSGSHASITLSPLAQGNNNGNTSMIATTSASTGYTGATGTSNFGAACFTGALNTSSSTYFTVSLTALPGTAVELSTISFGSRSTASGPTLISIRSSIDNYATDIATFAATSNSVWTLYSGTFAGAKTGSFGTSVNLRIYGSNGSGVVAVNSANWRLDDINLVIQPAICAAPTGSISASIDLLNCTDTVSTLTAPTATSYRWSNNATAPTIDATTPATYTVTASNGTGCDLITTKTITQNMPAPPASISGNQVLNCMNISTALTASGGDSYAWSNGSTVATSNAITTVGTYTVTVSTGICSTTSTAIISQVLNTICAAPSIMPTTSVNGSSVTFNWNQGCYIRYRVQYLKITSPATTTWNLHLVNAPASNFSVNVAGAGLNKGPGAYKWNLRGHCSISELWSAAAIGTNFNISSTALMAKTTDDDKKLLVFPNPANDYFQVELTADTDCFVRLIDNYGRTVYGQQHTIDGTTNLVIPVADLSTGTYTLTVVSDNDVRSTMISIQR